MTSLGIHETVSGGADPVSLIDAVFRWCECLKGRETIETALSEIGSGLAAEAATLSRVKFHPGISVRQICHDIRRPNATGAKLSASYAVHLLGPYLSSVRPGTVWLRSAMEAEVDPELDQFHRRRGFKELGLIPLSTSNSSADFLELHFPTELAPDQHALLNMIAGTLCKSWATRERGVFLENLLERAPARQSMRSESILGHDNPVGLSRAEYRVCLLLSRGLSLSAASDELSISRCTLRTHLRNIYAKTDTNNLAGLLYLLLNSPKSGRKGMVA